MLKGPVYCMGCDVSVANTIVFQLPSGYICDECEAAIRNQDGYEVASILPKAKEQDNPTEGCTCVASVHFADCPLYQGDADDRSPGAL